MVFSLQSYVRFLSINRRTAPTTAIATMMPATEGRKYNSAIEAGVGVGSAVGWGAATTTAYVVALELPYESSPAKVAII